ncbi:MAG: DUF3604 domain-containing protein [Moorea sp. SIO3B2]|nr:DUF3604 domain-containing protein [Moorena sp. SIO3B2]
MLFSSNSALAISLPPGEYDLPDFNRPVPLPGEIPYSPYAGRPDEYQPSHPQQVFWGDTHLHTVYSFDAGAAGTLLTPEDSYRFARGEEVLTDGGEQVQLSRPLDFLAVTDHTDQLGSYLQFVNEPPEDCDTPEDQAQIDEWHDMVTSGDPQDAADAQVEIVAAFSQGTIPGCMLQTAQQYRTAWEDEVNWAEEFNDPHKFTAVIAYEWTSLDKGNNLHRNVIFRDNSYKAKQLVPKTTEDGTDPELLWKWMENYEDTTGGDVLAIPHNGNLSNGEMFADLDARGVPISRNYAELRQRWEPLYEVIQIKGAGETHPDLSPDDEFASFEIAGWDNGNLDLSAPETPDMYEHEYARAALKNGLNFEEDLGANPFKFGMVGSTDSHIGISGVEENSFMGKFPSYTPSAHRAAHVSKPSCFTKDQDGNCVPEDPEVNRFGWQYGAAGFVGVWAEANTRESLFDAMARREVYATSGPRMIVRFFGGWDFTSEDVSRNPADVGYAKGVSMGSDLTSMPEGKAPTFLVAALKDPIRGNLDRIQIVKGWLEDGQTKEKVYDVVWSGDREPDATTGKLPPVGNTVNTDTAEWTNTIGAVELAEVWTDPDFDPTQRAFYYARVLEIPTPRWTDYDKAFYGNEWCAEDPAACNDIPLTLQERVYTSPIWYSPETVAQLPENPEDGSDFDFWNRIIQEVIR